MASIVGIDFGNDSCYVAVGRGGGIETVANDFGLRATPSNVSFLERSRALGLGGQSTSSIFGFKRLLGLKYEDPIVEQSVRKVPFTIVPVPDPEGAMWPGVKVKYLNEERVFRIEQITAMLLTKLKMTTEDALKLGPIGDCVVSVPSYFTEEGRQALLLACKIAGLEVLSLMNETTAIGLNYGLYKLQDLPAPEESPRNVVFVDFGHSALQVVAVAFNQGQLKVLASVSDPFIGGRNFDEILAKHFCKEFKDSLNLDVAKNHRAYLRLLVGVEKLKKEMSTVTNKLTLNIEAIMDDKDVKSTLSRDEFEKMANELFYSVEEKLVACLNQSGLPVEDIHSVEIVGGSTRIPAVKKIIEKVFHKAPSTTLNQDEAVARGCALQCAILSPKCKVKDFQIIDEVNAFNFPVLSVSPETYQKLVETENDMKQQDKKERDRSNAMNSLEEFIYGVRVNLDQDLKAFATDEQRLEILNVSRKVEDWLNEDEQFREKQAYVEQLQMLQALEKPIRERLTEYMLGEAAFKDAAHLLNTAKTEFKKMTSKDLKYAYLAESDVLSFQDACKEAESWMVSTSEVFQSAPKYMPAPVKAADIRQKLNVFQSMLHQILEKPKNDLKEGNATPEVPTTQTEQPDCGDSNPTETAAPQEQMDVE